MSKRLVLCDNPLLRKSSQPITEFNKSVALLAKDLLEVMRKNNGVGISAIQIGVAKRMIAYEYKKPKNIKSNWPNLPLKVLINPEIIKVSKKSKIDEEGCLSFPTLFGEVNRPYSVRVRALDLKGKLQEFDAKDLEARVIQHEIDHLDGILFIDRLVTPGKLYTYETISEEP
ncbi:peptide deformylase [Patescibacteria group bacterium]|nr:peptide deformylase [Patescibacteria group bacterium]